MVEAKIYQSIGEKDDFGRLRLTWDGHEFIADARKEDVWKKAKDRFGDTSFTVFKQGLVEIVKQLTLKASN